MNSLFFSSFSEQFGFTLLHSLWQGMIGVVILIIASRIVAAKYSTIRYWLFVSIMLLVFVANIFTLRNQMLESKINDGGNLAIDTTELVIITQSIATLANMETITSFWASNLPQFMPYLVMVWWLGILSLFVRMSINLWQINRLPSAPHLPVTTAVMRLFEQVKLRLNITKVVRLVQSNQILVPSVIGHLKPVILLPVGLVNGLSADQVEAILLHELSHIKRHDFLINIIQSIIEVLYFFNPFMWIISKAIRDEREHACDDAAISLGIPAPAYAETLAGIYNYAINRQHFAMAFATKNKLTLKRIQRIMKNQSNNNNKLLATMIFVIAITFSMYYGAQSHAPGQDMSDLLPDRTLLATALPTFSLSSSPNIKPINEKPLMTKLTLPPRIIAADTIDHQDFKKRTKEYDQAMDGLRATKEWQEVERLRQEMMKEQMLYMKDIGPDIEDAIRIAEESMTIDHGALVALEEKLARVTERMDQIEFSKPMEIAFELNSKVIEETMRDLQMQMEAINFEEIEQVAQVYAEEAKIYAAEARVIADNAKKVAAEAKKQVEAVENFYSELKPLLINDGYIKSAEQLESLRFKDDEVFVNGEKVKSRDAKRYLKIRNEYFAGDEDFIMN